MPSEHYTKIFYEQMRRGASRSAEVMVPIVLQLVHARSVVDVGCGDGNWLRAFQKFGVSDILGIDGDYVEKEVLQIPVENFRPADLAQPFSLGRTFDLAISLEVAEHLPAESAPGLVESLTRAAPVVLFSAAIPRQWGQNHVNEQWPDEWAKLFEQNGYLAVDCIRSRVWQNEAVEFWYAQNTLLYVRKDLLQGNPALKAEYDRTQRDQLSLVHPRLYLLVQGLYHEAVKPRLPSGVKEAFRLLLVCLQNAVRWRLGRRLLDASAKPESNGDAPRVAAP